MSTEHWDCSRCDYSKYGYKPPRYCPECQTPVGKTDEEYVAICKAAERVAWLTSRGPMPNMLLQLLFNEILNLLKEGRLTEAVTQLEKDIEILRHES